MIAGSALAAYLFSSVPLPEDTGPRSTVITDINGTEIGVLQAESGQHDVPLDSLPDHVVDAVLAAEDAAFFDHPGVSIPGMVRATVVNVLSGGVRQGGSTISQQLVKVVTDDTERTTMRKSREAVAAIKLERSYSKEEILERYLNTIYFGRGAYGIQAAARAYYGVDAAELEVDQAAQIAGIIPAPSRWDPALDPDAAERRYRYVLGRMQDEGWLTPSDVGRLSVRPPPAPVQARRLESTRVPFLTETLRRELAEVVGEAQVLRGLTVTTTIDLEVQGHAEDAYRDAFDGIDAAGALVAVDPGTGGIRAIVGGGDYRTDQLNLATARPGRAPASTFKAFALAAWIEEGYSPETYMSGPAELTLGSNQGGEAWEVSNFGGAAYGDLSVRDATERSVNTVYAQMAAELGYQDVVDAAQRAGIEADLRPLPSLVLGAQEVTPLELAGAFNTFAADGVQRRTTSIVRVERDGEVLWPPRDDLDTGRVAFEPQVSRMVTDVLRGVIESGTGTSAQIGRPAAGKTGTSSNHADAWFAGYTPDLTAVVWMGHRDDNRPLAGAPTGGDLPAETWARFMRAALEGSEAAAFPPPDGTGLQVLRPSPPPQADPDPEPEPVCDEGTEPVTAEDGATVCAPVPDEPDADSDEDSDAGSDDADGPDGGEEADEDATDDGEADDGDSGDDADDGAGEADDGDAGADDDDADGSGDDGAADDAADADDPGDADDGAGDEDADGEDADVDGDGDEAPPDDPDDGDPPPPPADGAGDGDGGDDDG